MWLKPLETAEDLQAWVVNQHVSQRGQRTAHRFLLREERNLYGPISRLSRTDRSGLRKARMEMVRLSPALAEQLARVWPVGAATGGRSPQTPARILELIAGPAAQPR